MVFDPTQEIWSDIDGSRYTKSVTFDAAPPQINEYEMTTPDPSSVASGSHDGSYDSEEDEGDISFDRGSIDRDDSFDASLEDIEKTPVVMPEDWRFMSPDAANDQLVKEDEDPFTSGESQSPEPQPSSTQEGHTRHSRVESLDSNGERRPLPPLPEIQGLSISSRTPSPDKLAAALELGSNGQRVLPAPPAPADYSKSDISGVGKSSMSLEDRLRLMMIQREERESASEQRDAEPETDKGNSEQKADDHPSQPPSAEEKCTPSAEKESQVFSPPRISRDSILRDLRKGDDTLDDSYETSSHGSSSPRHSTYDPDVPIPSLEADDNQSYEEDDDDTDSVVIKEEQDDDANDPYDLPDYYGTIPSKDSSLKDLAGQQNGEEESRHNGESMENSFSKSHDSAASEATPVPADQSKDEAPAPSEEEPAHDDASDPKLTAMLESLRRPVTPENAEQSSAPSTPDSVIRHPVDDEISDLEGSPDESIPDPIATVKAPGGSLKIRPSLTPADVEQMAATRRKVSGQIPPPDQGPNGPNEPKEEEQETPSEHQTLQPQQPEQPEKPESSNDVPRKPSLMKLDIPFSIQEDEDLGFGLDKEFDRVMETQKVAFDQALFHLQSPMAPYPQTQESLQTHAGSHDHQSTCANRPIYPQRGYLMRHNTKVIVADSRPEEPAPTPGGGPGADARPATQGGPPQRKLSQQTWTTVPWNSGRRRSSIRTPSGAIRKKPVGGPMPPLPGQPSIAQEPPEPIEEIEPSTAFEDGEERGRLFVKVVGLKYLDLPLPKGM